jgi:hypothetical protein
MSAVVAGAVVADGARVVVGLAVAAKVFAEGTSSSRVKVIGNLERIGLHGSGTLAANSDAGCRGAQPGWPIAE